MPQATYSIKTFADLRMYIAADMFRYMTSTRAKEFLRAWYIAGFRYTFFMRCCRYYSHRLWHRPLFLLCRIALRHYSVKYGFQIPWQTDIGPGLMIGPLRLYYYQSKQPYRHQLQHFGRSSYGTDP